MQQDTKIGFIGLGAMGFGMAASLCRAGFAVTGYDLREEALARLVERGGARALSPADAARGAALVHHAGQRRPGRGGAVRGRLRRRGAAGRRDRALEHGTGWLVRGLAVRLGERRLHLLDAPAAAARSGREGRAHHHGVGEAPAFAAADPALEACARKVYRLGDAPGIGASVKAVNQLLAGVNLVTAAEAWRSARRRRRSQGALRGDQERCEAGSGCSTTGCRTCSIRLLAAQRL